MGVSSTEEVKSKKAKLIKIPAPVRDRFRGDDNIIDYRVAGFERDVLWLRDFG